MSAALPTPITPPVFVHDQLPSKTCIRLIKIETDLRDGNVSCKLQHFDSADVGLEYVALSYEWGDPTPKHTVYINGFTRRIHQSLWEFLHRIWLDTSTEWFWTDSICPDQSDHSELNEQVARMGDIYSDAQYVVSWLGETRYDTEALEELLYLGRRMNEPDKIFARRCGLGERIQQAGSRMLNDTYWNRVWVAQEVVCARKCVVMAGIVIPGRLG